MLGVQSQSSLKRSDCGTVACVWLYSNMKRKLSECFCASVARWFVVIWFLCIDNCWCAWIFCPQDVQCAWRFYLNIRNLMFCFISSGCFCYNFCNTKFQQSEISVFFWNFNLDIVIECVIMFSLWLSFLINDNCDFNNYYSQFRIFLLKNADFTCCDYFVTCLAIFLLRAICALDNNCLQILRFYQKQEILKLYFILRCKLL